MYSAFMGFHFWYAGFVFFLWLSLAALNYRQATTLWLLKNRRVLLLRFYVVLVAVGLVVDYIIGQQVTRLWTYPLYSSVWDWFRLYFIIYPFGGLSILELMFFLSNLFHEKFVFTHVKKRLEIQASNGRDYVLDVLEGCLLIALPALYLLRVPLPFFALFFCGLGIWVVWTTIQFTRHIRHGLHWFAILCTVVLISVFLHEIPNTAVFEWKYNAAPIFNFLVLNIPLYMARPDQQSAWEREYRAQKLISPSNVPQADVMRFVRWLKKEHRKRGERLDLEQLLVLDLGSGTGRNAYYFAREGAEVTGIEFSATALEIAKKFAEVGGLNIQYILQSIGKPFPLADSSVDIVLDVTSSNSLGDQERSLYLREVTRVLKPGAFLFLRALSLEGDAHARELVRRYPGPDPDTYIHPDLGIVEKVFSREVLQATYGPYFTFRELKRTQHYATVAGRTYKRSYWVAHLERSRN